MPAEIRLRDAIVSDCQVISEIYNHYVRHDTCTYTEVAETLAERETWFHTHDATHPIIIAETDGVVVGTLSLNWSDPGFWRNRSDTGFVHRLAVERSAATQGLDEGLFSWAGGEMLGRGRVWLCVDVIYENARLRSYY